MTTIDYVRITAALSSGLAHAWFVWFHATCPRRFRWDIDFRHASKFGRSLIQTLNICLMYLFAVMSLCFSFVAIGVVRGPVAGGYCVFVAGLWVLRAGLQRWLIPASGENDRRWLGLFVAMAITAALTGIAAV